MLEINATTMATVKAMNSRLSPLIYLLVHSTQNPLH